MVKQNSLVRTSIFELSATSGTLIPPSFCLNTVFLSLIVHAVAEYVWSPGMPSAPFFSMPLLSQFHPETMLQKHRYIGNYSPGCHCGRAKNYSYFYSRRGNRRIGFIIIEMRKSTGNIFINKDLELI